MKLRPYQEKAKLDIQKFLRSSKKMGILVSTMATGKSIYTAIIAELTNKPILVLQPSKELLEQNLEKAYNFGIYPSVYSASLGRKEISDIVYATPQSVVKHPEKFEHIKIVVVDECHLQSTVKVTSNYVYDKGALGNFLDKIKPDKIIGLTATPVKLVSTADQGAMLYMMNRVRHSYFENAEIIHVTQIRDVCDEYWSQVLVQQIKPEKNVLVMNSNGSDFTEESLIRQFRDNDLLTKIQEVYLDCVEQGRKSFLTFVPSVDDAFALKSRLKDSTEVVTGQTPKKERDDIIRKFKQGNIRHVISVTALATGFDHPELDTLIMARETTSFAFYMQMYGRLIRPVVKDGKVIRNRDVLIDFTGNTERFGDIRDVSFENRDYTYGWAMFCGEKLMTGLPVAYKKKPTRKELQKDYDNELKIQEGKYEELKKEIELYKKAKMPVGKYRGHLVSDVVENDNGYVMWMEKNFNYSRPEYYILRKAIKYFIKKRALKKR